MMGYRKPAEDRAILLEEFTREGIDPEKYFRDRLAELERHKPRPDPRELETLLLLRDSLLRDLKKSKKTRSAKRAPARKVKKGLSRTKA